VLELEMGAQAMERRTSPQGGALRSWLTGVRAAQHIPDPRSERDAMIAATAIEHGFTVVTRNVQDFSHIRVGF
jgi:predicted nucleic acid-binding protein